MGGSRVSVVKDGPEQSDAVTRCAYTEFQFSLFLSALLWPILSSSIDQLLLIYSLRATETAS